MSSAVDTIATLFSGAELRAYLGEPVTLAEHMLQAGALAEAAVAPDHLVAAALLHDVGHVLRHSPDADRHAGNGADWLGQWFGASVTEAVRLHVDAKRYLCATEPEYRARLSAASEQSLMRQGGPMELDEAEAFIRQPGARDAVAVRRWDEAAKDASAPTPAFDHFRPLLERLLG